MSIKDGFTFCSSEKVLDIQSPAAVKLLSQDFFYGNALAFPELAHYNVYRQGELAKSRLRVGCCALTRNLIWIMPT